MSIRRRKTAKGVRYDVRLRDPSGKEYCRTFRTKREAETFEATERASRARGGWIDPRLASTTFADVAQSWIASTPAKRGGVVALEESILRNHLTPTLGARPVGSITRADVQGLVNHWNSVDLAPRTVRRQYGTLRAILNHAVASDLLARNPCSRIALPSVGKVKAKIIGADELRRLALALPPGCSPMVYLGAVLGLRWSECAALRVDRLDFLGRSLAIEEARTRGHGGAMVDNMPKSAASRRVMRVPPPLMDLLAEHLSLMGLTGADENAHVIVGPDGEPLRYTTWRRRIWIPASEEVAIRGLRFHDLRRSNATALVEEGVDMKVAQTRLGHSDIRLTLEVYAQATESGDQAAADAMGSHFMSPHREDGWEGSSAS